MTEFSQRLQSKMKEKGWNAKRTAQELGISLASFYNYRNKTDFPSYEVLQRAHDRWNWNFQYVDFGSRIRTVPSEAEQPRQYVLPFIENVHESDIRVIRAKAVKPDSLELTVQIRFAG